MKNLFSPRKHFKIGSCSKPQIYLKRELSHETRLPEIIPSTKHMLCDIVSWHYHWVQLKTLAKMTSSPGPCGQTWSSLVFHVLLIISALTCVVIVQWKRHHSTGDCSEYWPTTLRRILHIPLHKHTFFHTERVDVHRHGFTNCCWNGVTTWFKVWSVLSLCIQTLANKLFSMD